MVFRHGDKLTTFSLEHESDWKWQGYYNDKWMSGDRDQFRGSLAKWRMKPILLVYEAIKTTQPDSFKFYSQKEMEAYVQGLYQPSAEDEESLKIAQQLQAEFDQQREEENKEWQATKPIIPEDDGLKLDDEEWACK